VRAKLHDDAVARGLGANTAKLKYSFELLAYLGIMCVLKLSGYCRVVS